MRIVLRCVAISLACGISAQLPAAEGPSIAGPIGGTDIRSAMLPPPGLYGGGVLFGVEAFDFVDGNGRAISALGDADLKRIVGGAFVGYVLNFNLLGGSIGIGGFIPYGRQCGHLFAAAPKLCQSGFGDPYVEVTWSRFFGSIRTSRVSGALPIPQGLTIATGFGVVIPSGQYNAADPTTRALSSGSHIWDFAPHAAFTYTTPPILAEGTEFSTKIYWNKYRTNSATQYATGDLVNIDFAISERMGRVQAGIAGFYAFQVADDTQFGVTIPPDGQRAKILNVGGVVAYDLPEYGVVMKLKVLNTVFVENNAHSRGFVISVFKKLK